MKKYEYQFVIHDGKGDILRFKTVEKAFEWKDKYRPVAKISIVRLDNEGMPVLNG